MKNIFKRHDTQNEEIEEKHEEKDFTLHLTPSRRLNRRRFRSYLRRIKRDQ